jgi:cation diffusion facilitator CzcD-associated flavoprotein CzcO
MTERHRLAVIGAGPGGICTAIKLLEAGIDDFVLLEQGERVGGTWYHNRYPGAECDVMSHLYSYSFEPNPGWSQRYARQPEILSYLEHCAEKYGVMPHVSLETRVTDASWDEDDSSWILRTDAGRVVVVDILVSALGMFNEPVLPDIPGRETFAGRSFHSARWPDSIDLTGQRVAVVGSAASSVQLVPEVAKVANRLVVFQRTAIWVLPKDDRPYTDDDRTRFRTDPNAMRELRGKLERNVNEMMTFSDPDALARARTAGLENISVVADDDVRAKLTPMLPWGSRRPIVSNVYYPTFNRKNVELVTESIVEITPHGVRTSDGREREVDVIVFATGFDTTKYLSAISVTGRDGQSLDDAWSDDPAAYLGVVISAFPNLFMLYGPNTNNGSILRMLEYQVDFVVRFLQLMRTEQVTWIDLRPEAQTHFNRQLQRALDAVGVWRAENDGYYRGHSGRIVTQWPHTMEDYARQLDELSLVAFECARVLTRARRQIALDQARTISDRSR